MSFRSQGLSCHSVPKTLRGKFYLDDLGMAKTERFDRSGRECHFALKHERLVGDSSKRVIAMPHRSFHYWVFASKNGVFPKKGAVNFVGRPAEL